MVEDINYWATMQDANCRAANGDLDAETCGDCDYYLGSTCKTYTFGIDTARAKYGDNVCRGLRCNYDTDGDGEKKIYKHPKTWCGRVFKEEIIRATNVGFDTGSAENPADFSTLIKTLNFPGSRDFRFVCYNGEVTVEPCADFRQEICAEGAISGFRTSVCRMNRWRDCYSQDNKQDCGNYDKRDCVWVKGMTLVKGTNETTDLVENSEGQLVPREDDDDEREGAACIPKYTPGFDFWKEGTDATTICSQASIRCTAIVEEGVFGRGRIVTEEETILGLGKKARVVCVDEDGKIVADWKTGRLNLCSAIGDCGISINYIGEKGFYKEEDIMKILGEEEEE